MSTPTSPSSPAPVDILILGAGWLWHFLLPLLDSHNLSYAATSRTGQTPHTIPWTLGEDGVERLPKAQTAVVMFPVLEWETLDGLVEAYERERGECVWVMLGSTRGWQTGGTGSGPDTVITRHTPLPPDAPARSVVEERFLGKYGERGVVLNLAGLHGVPSGGGVHGAPRVVPNFLKRVAPSKDALREKGSLHLVHGSDAALAIVLVHQRGRGAAGRWIVSDGLVRDWWAVGLELGGDEVKRWVLEIMQEAGVGVLPRRALGRVVDGSEFWVAFGNWPRCAGMSV